MSLANAKAQMHPESGEGVDSYITPDDMETAFDELSLAWRGDITNLAGVTVGGSAPVSPACGCVVVGHVVVACGVEGVGWV